MCVKSWWFNRNSYELLIWITLDSMIEDSLVVCVVLTKKNKTEFFVLLSESSK